MKKTTEFKVFTGSTAHVQDAMNEFAKDKPGMNVISCNTTGSDGRICVVLCFKMY